MNRSLSYIQSISKSSLITLLLAILFAPTLLPLMPEHAIAATAGDGVIVVTLSEAPKTAAKVTATRAAPIPADFTGQEIPPETVTLSPGSGAKANNKGYTSPVLSYSGFSSQPCRDLGSDWANWTINVSGSATGIGSAHVECGGVVAVDVAVTLAAGSGGAASTTGVIKGTATAPDGSPCNSNSRYQLVESGTDPASISFQNNAGKPLPIDGSGNYTIGGQKPGNYDLYIDCVYGSGGNTNDTVQSSINVAVTAGGTANVTLGEVGQVGNVPTCESNGNALSWLFCPLITGLANAVDGIYKTFVQPMLRTSPIGLSTNSGDPTNAYAIWQNFRIYGNIFLIIALLAIVFSEALGGGMIDAYAARKMLPRLLIAAIAINLSIYIIAFAVDITNIIGNGIATLMEAPFKEANAFVLNIGGGTSALGLTALVGGGIWAVASLGPLLQFLFIFVLVPAFFVFIAILVTVIIRQALILFLIMVAPIAFALYVLPNTEQYFRKWWDLLFRTLLVYPIIAVIFALGNIMAVVINAAGKATGMSDMLASLLSIIALIVPLVAIPYSFRLAGGLIGRLHDVVTNYGKRSTEAIKGNANDPFSWRNTARRNLSNRAFSQREGAVNQGISMQKKGGIRGVLGRGLSTTAGFGNYEVRRSQRNKELADMVSTQVGTGGDNTVRAIFARQLKYTDKNGTERTGWFGTAIADDGNGGVLDRARYKEPQFAESEVAKARSQFAGNQSGYQAALTYEIGKAANDDELMRIKQTNLKNMSQFGYADRAGEVWIGSAYAQQGTRKELKHEKLKSAGAGKEMRYDRESAAYTQDVAETVGSWGLSNMRTSSVEALLTDYEAAEKYLENPDGYEQYAEAVRKQTGVAPVIRNEKEAEAIMANVRSTADALDARRAAGGSFALAGEGDDASPVSGAQTGAPGRVNQAIERLINKAASPRGGGPSTPPTQGPSRPPTSPSGTPSDPNRGYL